MDYYEQMKVQLNEELRSKILEAISRSKLPCNFESEETYKFLTLFITLDGETGKSKKKLSKYEKTHPAIDISYSWERNFDYKALVKLAETADDTILAKLFLIHHDLESHTWYAPITNNLKSWSKVIFHTVYNFFLEKYGLKLYRLPLEVYVNTPEDMYISKIPAFEDLWFFENSSKKYVTIDEIIYEQAETLKQISETFFNSK